MRSVPGFGASIVVVALIRFAISVARSAGSAAPLKTWLRSDGAAPSAASFASIASAVGVSDVRLTMKSFGEGNFKALFESMERDQIKRGALKVDEKENA